MLKMLTALTLALGGANAVTFENTESDVSENKIFPPKIYDCFTCHQNVRIKLFSYLNIVGVDVVCDGFC